MSERRVQRSARYLGNRQPAFPSRTPRPLKKRRSKGPMIWLLLIGAVMITVWFLFGIKSIVIIGVDPARAGQLQTVTEQILAKHRGQGSLLTIRRGQVEHEIATGQPQLKSVKLSRRWPSTIIVTVAERQPSLNWRTGEQSFLLDLDGSIIAPSTPQTAGLPTVVDSSNLPVKPGDRVVPTRFVTFCTEIVASLRQRTGLPVSGLEVPQTSSEVYVRTNKPFIIKFDTTRAAGEELTDLSSVLAELNRLHQIPAQYIDLRIEHRAYYK